MAATFVLLWLGTMALLTQWLSLIHIWMAAFAPTMASAKAAASSSGRERTKKASRWAVLRPMPGSRANCSTSFSRAGGKYCKMCIRDSL